MSRNNSHIRRIFLNEPTRKNRLDIRFSPFCFHVWNRVNGVSELNGMCDLPPNLPKRKINAFLKNENITGLIETEKSIIHISCLCGFQKVSVSSKLSSHKVDTMYENKADFVAYIKEIIYR